MEDCDHLLAFADRDPAASPGRAGVVGYTMSGPHAIRFAARHPERIGAVASICGIQLVTDQPDSPHRALGRATAEFYFACADNDEWEPLEAAESLEHAVRAQGAMGEVEVYEGSRHRFVFDGPLSAYDCACTERHWERICSLFQRRLRRAERM
jgi:carboxymethylenebutenolidase